MGVGEWLSHAADAVTGEISDVVHGAEDVGAKLCHEVVADAKIAYHAVEEGAHLGKIFVQSGLHAVIQDPIDGLEQLANHVIKPVFHTELPKLHIIDKPEVHTTAEKWAAIGGEVTGTVGSFFIAGAGIAKGMSLVGKLGEASVIAERLPLAARFLTTMGEIGSAGKEANLFTKALKGAAQAGGYEFFFHPVKDENNFWKHKLIGTAAWTAGGFGGVYLGKGVVNLLGEKGSAAVWSGSKVGKIAELAEKGGVFSALSRLELQAQHIADILGQNIGSNVVQQSGHLIDAGA